MKKLLVYILALGIITGIIPTILLIICEKFSILYIIIGIIDILLIGKELINV